APSADPRLEQQLPGFEMDPRYLRQAVDYYGTEAPGTIVIDTPNKFLFLVEAGGRAMRYGVGVGRPGFTWSGMHSISAKKEWPDWVPPEEMLQRQPGLPHFMAGGPNNPLGARAMYLGSSFSDPGSRSGRDRQCDAVLRQQPRKILRVKKSKFPFALVGERIESLQFGIDEAGMTHDQPAIRQSGQETRK